MSRFGEGAASAAAAMALVEEKEICVKGGGGPLLPLSQAEQDWPRGLRIVLYLLGLAWCFMGVSIISDVFMTAIEKVTSRKVRRFDKKRQRWYTFEVWNATVANLTLMALGSSAPEILLNVIDIFAKDFFLEGLGPSTIVGSAAFNLLMIIAVCVVSIPDGQVRYIKDTMVYKCTASWSIFAYLWLIVILLLISPHVVEWWEGVITFLFFPLFVFLSFMCDKGWLGGKRSKELRIQVHEEMTPDELAEAYSQVRASFGESLTDDQVVKILSAKHTKPRSYARYRVSATREMTSGKRLQQTMKNTWSITKTVSYLGSRKKVVPLEEKEVEPTASDCVFELPVTEFAALGSAGHITIRVARVGEASAPAEVYYTTECGTAEGSKDFVHSHGWLEFRADELEKEVTICILDNICGEDNRSFFFRLTEVSSSAGRTVCLAPGASVATVFIISDDDAGILSFPSDTLTVVQKPQAFVVPIMVQRRQGSRGEVRASFRTEGHTAIPDRDFEAAEGEVVFADKECQAVIEVTVRGVVRYDCSDMFRVILSEPEGGAKLDASRDGGSEKNILTVTIHADEQTKERVDRVRAILMKKWEKSKVGHTNWYSQFKEAFFVNGGGDDDGGAPDGGTEADDGENGPSARDYVVHVIALPWKLLFALVPPTDYCGGWLCFVCSLAAIGLVTAIVNDLASLLGCVLCIPSEITAITFVALGTSLPDTFASMSAAQNEPHADSSVGNVTGSNCVNVFLGLGMPWMIASFVWAGGGAPNEKWQSRFQLDPDLSWLGPPGFRQQAFVVKAGTLAYSVAVFSCCAVVCLALMAVRRRLFGGELGGPKVAKYVTAALLSTLWLIYISLSALKAMEVATGGCAS